jgi:Rrf2 family protein
MQQERNDPVSLKDIAEKEQISLKYLEAIFATLKKNKLVNSVRGKAGGYRLSKPANQINALEVLEALEGRVALVECTSNPHSCKQDVDKCIVRHLWKNLDDNLRGYLEHKTLESLIYEDI